MDQLLLLVNSTLPDQALLPLLWQKLSLAGAIICMLLCLAKAPQGQPQRPNR